MNRLQTLTMLFLWLFSGTALSDAAEDTLRTMPPQYIFVIDTIVIEGVRVTKPYIILREMSVQVGDTMSPPQIEENRKRIQNLGLFNRVEVMRRVRDQRNEILVRVTEEWYIFAMPFWRKEGGDFSKITYGLKYLQKNFRGRNERISTSVWTGYESGYQLSYSNPWLYGQGTWGLSVEVFRVKREVKNEIFRDLDAELETTGGRITCQRRFGLDTRLMVTLGVTRYQSDYPELMRTDELHDDWISISVTFVNDERDLYEYPTRGWYHRVSLSGSAMMEDLMLDGKSGVGGASLELRHYRQVWMDFILCERGIVAMSGGQVPLYRRFFLGSGTKVRGWRGDTEEGKGIFLGSLELRHPLFGVHYFTWERAPYAKQYFRNLKYGLSAGLFAELGQVWIEPGEAAVDKFQAGWGVGLHVHLPYLDILRLEAGWSPDSNFMDAKLTIHSRVAF